MSLANLFQFLCAQHVSDLNISIIRSLRLFCWVTTFVVLFLVRCVLEFRCGWLGVVSVLQAEAQLVFQPAKRKPLQTNQSRNSNTHRTKNNTINVVIQQNSRKLLMMAILMSETCWAHKKWNKIPSDIKMVFYSSTITMMHGPINIIFWSVVSVCSSLYMKALHIQWTTPRLHTQWITHTNCWSQYAAITPTLSMSMDTIESFL